MKDLIAETDAYVPVLRIHCRDLILYAVTMLTVHDAIGLSVAPCYVLGIGLMVALDRRRRRIDPEHPLHQEQRR